MLLILLFSKLQFLSHPKNTVFGLGYLNQKKSYRKRVNDIEPRDSGDKEPYPKSSENNRNLFLWNGSQLPVLSRDVEYLSYHRMVGLAVNMPISYFF